MDNSAQNFNTQYSGKTTLLNLMFEFIYQNYIFHYVAFRDRDDDQQIALRLGATKSIDFFLIKTHQIYWQNANY